MEIYIIWALQDGHGSTSIQRNISPFVFFFVSKGRVEIDVYFSGQELLPKDAGCKETV